VDDDIPSQVLPSNNTWAYMPEYMGAQAYLCSVLSITTSWRDL